MKGKTETNPQLNVFRVPLVNVINMQHVLVELSHKIDWNSVEKDFVAYYSGTGRPAVPVRKMVGSMLLKRKYNLTDESFICRWVENPYWQYFCGETYFQFTRPFNHSEFGHFRKRIGKDGAEKLLRISTELFEKDRINLRQNHKGMAEQFLEDQQFNQSQWRKIAIATARKFKTMLKVKG